MASTWNRMVPFKKTADERLEMLEWTAYPYPQVRKPGEPGWPYDCAPDVWIMSEEFEAEMGLDGAWKGRSAARVGLRDLKTGIGYSIGFMNFYNVAFRLSEGKVRGRWKVAKQGANYGLVAVDK